jgi:hypothetical protein
MIDYVNILKDSISTSVNMKIFKNKEDSSMAHIYKSKLVKISLSIFKNNEVDNFNSNRLQKSAVKAYPINNRPRGNSDINSVKYYQKQIQQKKDIAPIWMIQKNNKYTLLDGVHRVVASYIEDKHYINAYIIIL